MKPEIEILIKSIAELKASIVQNSNIKNMNLIIALCGTGGAIVGGIITVLLNLLKDKIMFKQNLQKEDHVRKQELLKREEDLTRKLVSRLFGLSFSIMHYAKEYNQCAVSGSYYCRMVDLEVDNESRKLFIELMREQNNQAQTLLSAFITNIQELSEIVGEYVYLMPDSKVGKAYTDFLKTEFHVKYNFENLATKVEVTNYRTKILNEHIKKLDLIVKNVFEIVQIIGDESQNKFKNTPVQSYQV